LKGGALEIDRVAGMAGLAKLKYWFFDEPDSGISDYRFSSLMENRFDEFSALSYRSGRWTQVILGELQHAKVAPCPSCHMFRAGFGRSAGNASRRTPEEDNSGLYTASR
jgi:hypothetical protein